MDKGAYIYNNHCSDCGKPSNQLMKEWKHNVNGKLVSMLKPGEQLCPACAQRRGHKSLAEINEERMMELIERKPHATYFRTGEEYRKALKKWHDEYVSYKLKN